MSYLRFSLIGLVVALGALLVMPAAVQGGVQEETEEFRQTYDLNFGSRVKIHSFNGPVKVETWNQPRAEVYIVKTSQRGAAELQRLNIIVDHSANSLDIRTQKVDEDYSPKVKVSVEVKLPYQMDLRVSGINGTVEIGAVEGPVEASGINGRLRIEQANESLHVSGVNGTIQAALGSLGSHGIRMSGINGTITIGLPDNANADIDVTGHNGQVNSDLPLSVIGVQRRNEFRAQMGSGGAPIRLSGINGGIHLKRSAGAL